MSESGFRRFRPGVAWRGFCLHSLAQSGARLTHRMDLPFRVLRVPVLRLKVPRVPTPSPSLVLLALVASYWLVTSGIIYDMIMGACAACYRLPRPQPSRAAERGQRARPSDRQMEARGHCAPPQRTIHH